MQFNPDINKKLYRLLSLKREVNLFNLSSPLFLSEAAVVIKDEEKHLDVILDPALNFHKLVRKKIVSVQRGTGVICYPTKYASRNLLDQMYK